MTYADFLTRLCELAPEDAVFVADAGNTFFGAAQHLRIRGTQRFIAPGAQSCMGWSLPAAIGAALAGRSPVYAFTGDGSLQMNVQELQTLKHHHLPVKLFVINNGGYRCIEGTQDRLCGGRWIGITAATGLSLPDTEKIAQAYGLPFYRLIYLSALPEVLACSGPCVCEVVL